MKPSTRFALVAAALIAFSAGCQSAGEEQPSYAELVVIYNQELQALDRLENKKKELIAEYQAELRPDVGDALRAFGGAFGSASNDVDSDDDGTSDLAVDPQAMLDQAVRNSDELKQAASQLLDAALETQDAGDGELSAEQAALRAEFERKLAEIDAEIQAQQTRVERARVARDAAEDK